jgi:hypothetical protein
MSSARIATPTHKWCSLPLRLVAGLCLLLSAAACTNALEPTAFPTPTAEPGAEVPADPRPDIPADPEPEILADPGPRLPDPAPLPEGAVPAALVGTWNGGPGDSSDSWLTFRADGSYVWTWDGFLLSSGVAQVTGDRLRLVDTEGGGVRWLWDLDEFGILHISDQDGFDSTYVPA